VLLVQRDKRIGYRTANNDYDRANDMDSRLITTYEPDNSLKKGYKGLFTEIYNEFKANRWLMFQLFKKDFVALYTQSFIGFMWAVIIPLITVGTFIVLSGSGVFNAGAITVPYALYAILGVAIWQLFAAGLPAISNSLVLAGPMITKIKFSLKSLVAASMGQSLLSFLVQFCLVVVLLLYYRFVPSAAILLLPLLIIPIILMTLGLGFIFSLLNGVLRDIGNLLSVCMTFLLFLTPILYAKPTTGVLGVVSTYNPLYYLVAVPRDLVLTGTVSEWRGFVLSSALAAAVFLICLVLFHLTETRVTERI
jgi:lipopolysaccharide transport system permease protein